jgi:signal transduction histidine kinase
LILSFLQSKLISFHLWLTRCPSHVLEEDRSGHAVLCYAVFSGGIAHFFFIILFFFTDISTLAIVNIFSVSTFILARWILNSSANIPFIIFLCVLEVVGHSYIATYILGWDSSFHYYILLFLGLFPLAVFTWSARIVGSLLILFTYLGLWYLSHHLLKVQVVISSYEIFFSMMNITIFIIVLGFTTSFQGWLTFESKKALAREIINLEQAHRQINTAYHELKQTQAQLVEAEKLASLGQLVGGIAHEINNPISVVQSNSELLKVCIRSTLREIPTFLEKLSAMEREIFYEIVEKSVKNKDFLNTKEERKLKKEIEKELNDLLSEKELSHPLADSLITLRLFPPYNRYFEILKTERFQEFIAKAQIFKYQSTSISNIELSIERVSRVIFSLRSYLNSETHLPKREMDLVKELQNALHLYDNYILGKIITTINFPLELKYICIAESLSQVWKNIIFNAIQSMYNTEKNLYLAINQFEQIPQKYMSYSFSDRLENIIGNPQTTRWIFITIQDSGEGVPEDLQSKIFSPFFTTKPMGEGIGLGLYVCKKIVNDHGGILFFKSSKGNTEFVVGLPQKLSG